MKKIFIFLLINILFITTNSEHNNKMKISKQGFNFLIKQEGFKLKAYKDIGGVISIGIGTTGYYPDSKKLIKIEDEITKERAMDIFKIDLREYENMVNRNVKVELNQNQFDSLVSFAYNLGEGNLKKICENINRNDFEGAAERMLLYSKVRIDGKLVKIKGLVDRRKKESELFSKEVK